MDGVLQHIFSRLCGGQSAGPSAGTMEVYQSLSDRVSSMEGLLHSSESTMEMVLERMRALEEYVSRKEACNQNGNATLQEGLLSHLNRMVANNNEKTDALQNEMHRQVATTRVIEEKLQSSVRSLEQKINSDVAGCYQRIQSLEASLSAAVRNLESSVHKESLFLKSLEQVLHSYMNSIQQKLSDETANTLQRVTTLDAVLQNSLSEIRKVFSDDIKSVSAGLLEGFNTNLQRSINSLQDSVKRDIETLTQNASTREANTQDSIQSLYRTLATDIGSLLSRVQASETNYATAHQQVIAELQGERQRNATVNSDWRSSFADLSEKVQKSLEFLRTHHESLEASTDKKMSLIVFRVDELSEKLNRGVESITHTVFCKANSLEALTQDVVRNSSALSAVRDEQLRLHRELEKLSSTTERSAMHMQSVMEIALRASHSDLLERIRSLACCRPEMHSVVTSALNRLWLEAKTTFVSQDDARVIEKQIQTLDKALRCEVSLLAKRDNHCGGQYSLQEGNERLDAITGEGCAIVDHNSNALTAFPVVQELNSLWVELRNIQQSLGVPREEVLNLIGESRKQILDTAVAVAQKNGEEFSEVLLKIQESVRDLIPWLCGKGSGAHGGGHVRNEVVASISPTGRRPPSVPKLPPLAKVDRVPAPPQGQPAHRKSLAAQAVPQGNSACTASWGGL